MSYFRIVLICGDQGPHGPEVFPEAPTKRRPFSGRHSCPSAGFPHFKTHQLGPPAIFLTKNKSKASSHSLAKVGLMRLLRFCLVSLNLCIKSLKLRQWNDRGNTLTLQCFRQTYFAILESRKYQWRAPEKRKKRQFGPFLSQGCWHNTGTVF